MSIDQAIRRALLHTYQTMDSIYLSVKFNTGSDMSIATFDRSFRKWRQYNPDLFESKEFKAKSGSKYKKFRIKKEAK